MPPPLQAPLPPSRAIFDPWNSISAGHQRDSHNPLVKSSQWRQSRTAKLGEQFRGGAAGRATALARTTTTTTRTPSVAEMLMNGRSGARVTKASRPRPRFCTAAAAVDCQAARRTEEEGPTTTTTTTTTTTPATTPTPATTTTATTTEARTRKVFDQLNFYVNGSTAPRVSDHRLKYLIVANGGRVSLALGRRTVTHVVLGIAASGSAGAGGGLAAGKQQREIQRRGGCAVKYVSVDW
ncbi:MAG: hypothetical protein M1826_001754 [Phylliscum demangeonii]|nr:MAG: hypothetical protein M1826_001754 [Phylliscum demangeonii]